MTLSRLVIASCGALVALVLSAALLIRGGDGPFHVIETAATPTVEVAGLPAPSMLAERAERVDLDRLAMTALVLFLLASAAALVTLLGAIVSENLAAKARRAIEVMLGAPPRWLVGAAARVWKRRLLVSGAAGALACAGSIAWLVRTAPPGTEFARPAIWLPPLALAAVALLVFVTGVAPVRGLYRPGRSLSRETERRQYTDPRPQKFNRVLLVAFQFTITVAILASSGLMILSADRPTAVAARAVTEPDLERGQTVVGQLSIRSEAFGDPSARASLYESVLAALRDSPAVAAESLATPGAWLGRGPSVIAINQCGPCFAGGMPNPIHRSRVRLHAVMPGFFAERGMRILRGRGLAAARETDLKYGRPVVINDSYARAHFIDPVGKAVMLRGGDEEAWYDVVGVVSDAPRGGLGDSGSRYAVYYSAVEHPPAEIEFVATVDVPGAARLDDSLQVVREALTDTPDGDRVVITGFRRASDDVARVWGTAGWMGGGTRVAGLAAALVAVAGVMGTLRAHVGARLRELGIRAALGAPPRTLRRIVLLETLWISVAGTGLGLWAATFMIAFLSPRAVAIFNAPLFVSIAGLFIIGALLVGLPSARLAATAQPRTVMGA